MGSTQYLDGIRDSDLSYPVMIGIDKFRRPFISIKYRCCQDSFSQNCEEVQIEPSDRVFTLTIFQRYTDNSNSWCKAGRCAAEYMSPLLNGSRTLLSQKEISLVVKNIFTLLDREELEYQYYGKTESEDTMKKIKCQLVF